ncbi:hypothetical protein ACFVS9_28310 [Streptomyces sp. NPDC058008]|uniref:hypothetical protein n=1 Tax=Streptomyces sp. NPDC058008 TaxID=3346303 RepID=UPI0036E13C0F
MTAAEFRQTHADPTTWTTADHETYDNLRRVDQHIGDRARTCWFCAVETPAALSRCQFCNHHVDDGPEPAQASTNRLHKLLAPAA